MEAETLDAPVTPLVPRATKRCPACAVRFGARDAGDARFCPHDGAPLVWLTQEEREAIVHGTCIDGRYEVLALLGEGGMGTVYEVRHIGLDRVFALKVLRKDYARDAELAARFTQEARATGCIRHPNVVAATDFGTLADGRPYFVMEHLVGETLASRLKRERVLSPEEAVPIALAIAEGLEAAHAKGVIHRDLKPENVFLVPTGEPAGKPALSVKVVDFGAAKLLGGARLTKSGFVFGTPHYMAPELVSGKAIDARVDVYALGVMLYQMVTGRLPFEAETYMAVLTQHMFVEPTPPSAICGPSRFGPLAPLEAIILRALEKRLDRRYESMRALADALRRLEVEPWSEQAPASFRLDARGASTSSAPVDDVAGVARPPTPAEADGASLGPLVMHDAVGEGASDDAAPIPAELDEAAPSPSPATACAPVVAPPARLRRHAWRWALGVSASVCALAAVVLMHVGGANVSGANVSGANVSQANVSGASVNEAQVPERAASAVRASVRAGAPHGATDDAAGGSAAAVGRVRDRQGAGAEQGAASEPTGRAAVNVREPNRAPPHGSAAQTREPPAHPPPRAPIPSESVGAKPAHTDVGVGPTAPSTTIPATPPEAEPRASANVLDDEPFLLVE
jgi:serine/threonine-protein kinase